METRRWLGVLVVAVTFAGGVAVAKRHPRKPTPPKVSDRCATDADCAFTAMGEGECCPMLCPPRVVSKASAEALKKYAAACKKPEGGCPVPECMPPRMQTTPACVSGRCVARAAPAPTRE